MAYKYTTGSTFRGDIYAEDDAQGNTYLDWSEDALGVVAGGALTLTVSGAVVNVSGSGIPLVVDGAVSASSALYGTDLVLKTGPVGGDAGSIASIYIQGTSGTEIIGLAGGNMDIRSDGGSLNLLGGTGGALYLGSDNDTYRVTLDTDGKLGVGTASPASTLHVSGASTLFRVDELSGAMSNPVLFVTASAGVARTGIGHADPSSTFQVSGSEASNYTSFTANVTLNETHHVVAFTGDTGVTGTLPAVAGCTGRIYHVVNSLDQDSNPVVVKGNSSENVGNANTLDLDAGQGNSSVMIVSNGSSWVILGKYAETGGH